MAEIFRDRWTGALGRRLHLYELGDGLSGLRLAVARNWWRRPHSSRLGGSASLDIARGKRSPARIHRPGFVFVVFVALASSSARQRSLAVRSSWLEHRTVGGVVHRGGHNLLYDRKPYPVSSEAAPIPLAITGLGCRAQRGGDRRRIWRVGPVAHA